jgi:hypothetical protein
LSLNCTTSKAFDYKRNVSTDNSRPATCFHADILLGLFDPEHGGDKVIPVQVVEALRVVRG